MKLLIMEFSATRLPDTGQGAVQATFPTHIREIIGSNLGLTPAIMTVVFRGFSQSLQTNVVIVLN
jgi:hypothetical protein